MERDAAFEAFLDAELFVSPLAVVAAVLAAAALGDVAPVLAEIERVIVSDAFDAADDWIAERAGPGAVVVTGDILLADRCLKAGASAAIAPNGRLFTTASIGGRRSSAFSRLCAWRALLAL